jgi:hypothetical protein
MMAFQQQPPIQQQQQLQQPISNQLRPQQQQQPAQSVAAAAAAPTDGSGQPSKNIPVNLTNTMDDVGRGIEMFSFRWNIWERIDLVDFDSNRKMYKCQYPNGNIQWLDLSKKPIRALPDEVIM